MPAREFHSLRTPDTGPPNLDNGRASAGPKDIADCAAVHFICTTGPPGPTESPPATDSPPGLGAGGPSPGGRDPTLNSQLSTINSAAPDTFTFKGRTYRPNNLFRTRILALFPDAGDESLIPLRWIEAALSNRRNLPPGGYIRAAIDVARFGDDDTVIAVRNGPVVEPICVVHGNDTMAIAERIKQLAYARHPHSIAVDSIGIGAGVVDRLRQLGIEGVVPINVARAAHDPELFANRRAELYWGLRERFHEGTIVIPYDEKLVEELAAIRYVINSKGQIQIESKAEMKRRLGGSPDRADALAMLMDSSSDWVNADEIQYIPHGGRIG